MMATTKRDHLRPRWSVSGAAVRAPIMPPRTTTDVTHPRMLAKLSAEYCAKSKVFLKSLIWRSMSLSSVYMRHTAMMPDMLLVFAPCMPPAKEMMMDTRKI